jgi:hypothetical protein
MQDPGVSRFFCGLLMHKLKTGVERFLSGGRTYLVEEGVILVGDQQYGGRKRQISTPVAAFLDTIT